MPIGRPTKYTPALGDAICERLIQGETLRQVCADEGMPDKSTVCRWLLNVREPKLDVFRDQDAKAREAQMDHYADEIIEIADDGTNDWIERERDGETETVLNGEHINRSRLRVDTRKWLMSKIGKKYRDKQEIEHSGTVNAFITFEEPKK